MRRVVLDTETTGLEPAEGHRIIEVACIELYDRRPTGRHFHRYLNPERAVDLAASQVHGMTNEDLSDKPRFADIADELLGFVEGAELLIHNAAFDVGFLDAELDGLGEAVGIAGDVRFEGFLHGGDEVFFRAGLRPFVDWLQSNVDVGLVEPHGVVGDLGAAGF